MKLQTPRLFIATIMISLAWTASAQAIEKFHSVHLMATDAKEAAAWYGEHLGGVVAESGDLVMFGDVALVWLQKKARFPGSEGSSVDHIGFSFGDIDNKMIGFEAAGIKIVERVRTMGDWKLAFIEDPWGTKIEIIQDPDLLGFHHVHLHTPDPDSTLAWYADAFGGEITTFKGARFLPSIRYPNMWLIAQRVPNEKKPTKGRSVDHIIWSFADLDAAAEILKAKGVKFTMNPMTFGNIRMAFIVAPNGVTVELIQPAVE